jgi:molybdate transport system substrate-binding protein
MAKKIAATGSRKKWHKDWSVGVRVWVESQGQTVLEEPTADLLGALERTHSISGAARLLGISYRHAWLQIQSANTNAGQPLVETATGGERGGGTELTDYGRAALEVFRQIQEHLRSAAAKSLAKVLAPIAGESTVLHLAAAISLQEAIAQILSEYALVRPTVSVRTMFGASNELAEQIQQGASVDIFISASGEPINLLAKSGFLCRGSRRIVASNGLAIVATPDFRTKLLKPSDLGELSDCEIVVADPACPLGGCTKRFLQRAKIYSSLKSQLVTVDNSRAVIGALRAGLPRVGIIFSSDIGNAVGLKTLLELPLASINTNYEAAVLAASSDFQETNKLLEFLNSATAATCFRRCGFTFGKG